MKQINIAVAALMVVAAPAFGQSTATPPSAAERTGINKVAGTSPGTADFVREAAVSDMFELQSSELASQRGDAPTKTFAAQMVTDHTRTSADLKSLVAAGTVKAELPAAMDSSHVSKLNTLKGLNGRAFDARYHADQVSAHRDAVSLFQRYAAGGDNAALKAWAAKTLPDLQHHLQMAQSLKGS